MHQIHVVEDDRIVLKEVHVSDFAVQLKIGGCSRPKVNFRDETKRYLEDLVDLGKDAIDIDNLIDEEHRITFVRGIAGIGKSVLAKQLSYGWANGEIYQNFKMCVMFECRHLNYFKDHEGAKLEKHKILGEFLKSIVNYDLGDGEGVLVIVDGLDELYDITERDSIIGQLLTCKISPMSKVILTGRPHIEFKLDDFGDVGGFKTVEIQGLTTEQIKIYVEKFSKLDDHLSYINKARGASNVPIIHVPQFLNTFCCIATLLKGRAISNNTELYCWTIFLLLRQHADKHGASGKGASEIFNDFSQLLSTLSEICHNLLGKNKIIFEGDMKLLLGDIGKDKEFIESLFHEVSDSIAEKYQFKYLSLMEFLSALCICTKDRRNLMDAITDSLEKGFIEVVLFVCQLLSGCSYEGIVQEMLNNFVRLTEKVNENELLRDVIEMISECGLNDYAKTSISLEIIAFFLNKNFTDTEFIKSILAKCHCNLFHSKLLSTDNICKICMHLESCGWKQEDIAMAFANVVFDWIEVSNMEQLEIIAVKQCLCRYFGSGIWLRNMDSNVNTIRLKLATGIQEGYYLKIWIHDCDFEDDISYGGSNNGTLDELFISGCELRNITSFINLCDWGMSCTRFLLSSMDINAEWWEKFVKRIKQRISKGDMSMMELHIHNCSTELSHEMAARV